MKLFDKIKDLFMDEVEVDDEIEIGEEEEEKPRRVVDVPKKEENVLPKVMRDTIKKEEVKKEEKVQLRVNPDDFMKELSREEKVKEEVKPEKKIDLPPKRFIEFTDADLEIPSRNNHKVNNEIRDNTGISGLSISNKEPVKKVSELYSKKEEVKEKPGFKPTPVISPVYGILDKNYTKEEVKERDSETSLKRPSKKVDFEMVRKKAFGNLADEIKDNLLCENCELYKEVKKISALKEDDLLYDMTVEPESPKEVTIEKAYENYQEFGVAYEPKVARKTEVAEDLEVEEPKKEEPELVTKVEHDDSASLDDIINNSQDNNETFFTEEEVNVLEKPDTVYQDKVDDEEEVIDLEEMPKRSTKKKEEKVDDDFFELIDSMYKERTDD